jgi:hypothetical protein
VLSISRSVTLTSLSARVTGKRSGRNAERGLGPPGPDFGDTFIVDTREADAGEATALAEPEAAYVSIRQHMSAYVSTRTT